MTSEYGYNWPERHDDTRCECGRDANGLACDRCGDWVCDECTFKHASDQNMCPDCHEQVGELIVDDCLWEWMGTRRPEDIIHSAWAHSQNGRDISTPAHEETVMIFQASLAMIRAGWSEAA